MADFLYFRNQINFGGIVIDITGYKELGTVPDDESGVNIGFHLMGYDIALEREFNAPIV
jgi:hypothetical protein